MKKFTLVMGAFMCLVGTSYAQTPTGSTEANTDQVTLKDKTGKEDLTNIQKAGTPWILSGNASTDDTDYIGTSDAKGLSIRTDAVHAIYIDNHQRVGLNTTAPQGLLHLNSADDDESIIIGNGTMEGTTRNNSIVFTEPNTGTGNNQIRWLDGNGNALGGITTSTYGSVPGLLIGSAASNGFISLHTGGTNNSYEKMRLTSTGSLGIGTTAPSRKLHVVGKARITDLPTTTVTVDMVVADASGNLYRQAFSNQRAIGMQEHVVELEDQLASAYMLIDNMNERLSRLEAEASSTTTNISNHPNPFETSTIISYTLKADAMVEVSIFNTSGQLVSTLFSGKQSQGSQQLEWNSENLPAGSYLYTVTVDGEAMTNRAVLVK
jgi:hypothetical protein